MPPTRKRPAKWRQRSLRRPAPPAPPGRVRWTLTLLTEEMSVGLEVSLCRTTIGRVLNRNELHLHLSKYWCIPPKENAEFVANMEDNLDLYQRPYDPRFPLWCMDEKPYQILGEASEPLLMRKGALQSMIPIMFETVRSVSSALSSPIQGSSDIQ